MSSSNAVTLFLQQSDLYKSAHAGLVEAWAPMVQPTHHEHRSVHTSIIAGPLIITLMLVMSCSHDKPASAMMSGAKQRACPATPAKAVSQPKRSGTVLETIDAADYTYVSITTGTGTIWAVAPKTTLSKGDSVNFDAGMPVENFVSKTLNRTFPVIYFTSGFERKIGDAISKIKIDREALDPSSPEALPRDQGPASSKTFDFSGITRPADGKTVAELFAQKNSLAGKKVTLRGKIVHANYAILGKTWLHVQDGTGENNSADVTVTTKDETPKKGDLVLITGTLNKDKNIGSGRNYPVILEDATVTVEVTGRIEPMETR